MTTGPVGRSDPPRARVILIEGIPGSGKTTTASWLSGWLGARGLPAEWVPELKRDHPVIDRDTLGGSGRPGYGERCAARWQAYARARDGAPTGPVQILEGCLFQGSVRRLLEEDRGFDEARALHGETERALAPLAPRLLLLRPADPGRFVREQWTLRKGRSVVERIVGHSESTPLALRQGWAGLEGTAALYAGYRDWCDRLLRDSRIPRLELDSGALPRGRVQSRVAAWLEDELVLPSAP